MVLKMRRFSATFVSLLLVVLFADANTEEPCAMCDRMNVTTSFVNHIGNTTCLLSNFVPEVCNAYYNLSQCLNASGCKDFENVTTEVAPTVCTVAHFEENCKGLTAANTEAPCARCDRINATTSFVKHIGTNTCLISSFVPEVCNAYYNLSQCLNASGCKDFETVTTEVAPTVCTVAHFEKNCKRPPAADREAVCAMCDRINRTISLVKLLGNTTCLISRVDLEICRIYFSLSQCLDSVGCNDFGNKTMTVAPTVCTVADLEYYCWKSPEVELATSVSTEDINVKVEHFYKVPRPRSGRQSGANDLSAYTTVGYPLVLFLCQAAVILLVLR